MAIVRLDAQTEAELKRLAARRGQTRSEVVRDAINRLAAEDTEQPSADQRLGPFVGIVDSGGRQLSTATGRKLRELLAARLSLPHPSSLFDIAMSVPFGVFTVRDLRNRTGDLMRYAEKGHLSIITKHGRPAILAIPFDERLLAFGVHRSLAVHLFEAGQATLAQAAKLAELSVERFLDVLAETGVPAVSYPKDGLAAEVESAR